MTNLFTTLFNFKSSKNRSGKAAVTGEIAPDFELTDHNGNIVRLSGFRNNRNVLLIFFKGVWCPMCQMTLRAYLKEGEKLMLKNITILGIGPDSKESNNVLVKNIGLDYRILSDEKHVIAINYDVHSNDDKSKYEEGMIIPTVFLIDKKGIIRFCSKTDSLGTLEPESIYKNLDKLK